MASLFQKCKEVAKSLTRHPTFAKDPRQLQLQADIHRLFLYTSHNKLGKNADEAAVEEIIEMAKKVSFADQQIQVQENVHSQIKVFCKLMDGILLPDEKMVNNPFELSKQTNTLPRRSGLSFAVGRSVAPNTPDVPRTRSLIQAEVSQKLKEQLGYTLNVKPSQISHKDAGQGLFLDGTADVGAVVAIYPGVIYSPAYYRYIPGYPKVNAHNPYLITRYDCNVINAQPWGNGGDTREPWNYRRKMEEIMDAANGAEKGSETMWRMLNKPLREKLVDRGEVLELRNPLAFAHFANHPPKGMEPNVMICPYDFPLVENSMRVYVPNVWFGNGEEVTVKRLGSFYFRTGVSKRGDSHVPTLKTLVLVATSPLRDEELLLNYRLSNAKRRPDWYVPVDEEEDKRRWS